MDTTERDHWSPLRRDDKQGCGMDKTFTVYLLASRRHGTLYAGMTSDLPGRIHQHRARTFAGFTATYDVHRLVWLETHRSVDAAITRERRIKEWRREWKINLIEADNPDWSDLAVGFGFEPVPVAVAPFRTVPDS